MYNVTRPVVYSRRWAASFFEQKESFLFERKRNPRFANLE